MILTCPFAELPWRIVNHEAGGSLRAWWGGEERKRTELGRGMWHGHQNTFCHIDNFTAVRSWEQGLDE